MKNKYTQQQHNRSVMLVMSGIISDNKEDKKYIKSILLKEFGATSYKYTHLFSKVEGLMAGEVGGHLTASAGEVKSIIKYAKIMLTKDDQWLLSCGLMKEVAYNNSYGIKSIKKRELIVEFIKGIYGNKTN